MSAYNAQRVGAATVALGIAEGAFALALEHTKTREQFGRPIAEFQGLQWMLADMSIALAAAQALIYRAADSAGSGFPDAFLAAQAKVLAADTAIKVTNDALQLFGSAGYSRRQPLERMVRDARMFTISAAPRRSCGIWWRASSSTAACRRQGMGTCGKTALGPLAVRFVGATLCGRPGGRGNDRGVCRSRSRANRVAWLRRTAGGHTGPPLRYEMTL